MKKSLQVFFKDLNEGILNPLGSSNVDTEQLHIKICFNFLELQIKTYENVIFLKSPDTTLSKKIGKYSFKY